MFIALIKIDSMKNSKNWTKQSLQYTKDIDGYAYDGIDGSQMKYDLLLRVYCRTSTIHASSTRVERELNSIS